MKVAMVHSRLHTQYLNRAFSAPSICTVEDGCLARFIREPITTKCSISKIDRYQLHHTSMSYEPCPHQFSHHHGQVGGYGQHTVFRVLVELSPVKKVAGVKHSSDTTVSTAMPTCTLKSQ